MPDAQDILEKIQALPEEHRERIMGEYIKMKLRQRKRLGWGCVNFEILIKLNPSKLKIQNLRQFISKPPAQTEEEMEEVNQYLQKNLFHE